MIASGKKTAASLPPSSRVTRVSVLAAMAMIRLPPATDPVKQTFATLGLSMSAAMFSSGPVTTLSTPAGTFSATRWTRVVASGADGGGLTITVLPASKAWGRAAPRMAIGQLNGTMIETTPSG